jgi:hypothetical protein
MILMTETFLFRSLDNSLKAFCCSLRLLLQLGFLEIGVCDFEQLHFALAKTQVVIFLVLVLCLVWVDQLLECLPLDRKV